MNKYLIVALLCGLVHCTVYSVNDQYQVTYQQTYDELAHASYEQKINEKGWNYLHVYANSRKSLLEQHRGAGFIQGFVTYKDIYAAYKNLCGSLIKSQNLNEKAQSFIDQQLNYIDLMISTHPFDLYWQYAEAKMEQLRFMYRGFLTRIHKQNRLDYYIGFTQFYYLTNTGDLEDLIPAFHNQETHSHSEGEGNCNLIAKLINNQIYIGHSTHNIYQFLLRIFKTYHFPSRDQRVGSDWITFSSRPGDLISKDDFYVLSSKLRVMQTSLNNYNPKNYESLSPETMPCWLRATIAVHLARTTDEWVDYFLKERSGTHNNQWVIIDPRNVFSRKNVVTFVEEGFSVFDVIDMTDRFFSQNYISSYNMPVSEKVYNQLKYGTFDASIGPVDYDSDPRAIQYAKYYPYLNSIEDMKIWLIKNDNDDPTVGIAPRYDQSSHPSAFGLTDCKIIAPQIEDKNYLWAISGPTTSGGRFPPFSWQNWSHVSHEGMPIKWNFDWIKFPINIEKPIGATLSEI